MQKTTPTLKVSENTRCFLKKKSPTPIKILLTISNNHGQYDKPCNRPLKYTETIVIELIQLYAGDKPRLL